MAFMTCWPFAQAGHRVNGILQAIPCVEAAIGQAGYHASIGEGVFAFDEDVDGQVESKGMGGCPVFLAHWRTSRRTIGILYPVSAPNFPWLGYYV